MRTNYTLRYEHQVIAVVAIMLVSFAVKMFFLSPPTAEADMHAVSNTGLGILQMRFVDPNRNNRPMLKMDDMTVVFSVADE